MFLDGYSGKKNTLARPIAEWKLRNGDHVGLTLKWGRDLCSRVSDRTTEHWGDNGFKSRGSR